MNFSAGKKPKEMEGRKEEKQHNTIGYIGLSIMAIAIIALFMKADVDLASVVFKDVSKVKDPHFIPMAKQQPPENESIPPEEPTRQNIYEPDGSIINGSTTMEHIPQKKITAGEVYQYKDKNGTISFTDNPNSATQGTEIKTRNWNGAEREKVVVKKGQGRETSIIVDNDRVYVPVSIRSGGNENNMWLLLDTGATGISIYNQGNININLTNTRRGYTTVADGRRINTIAGKVEAVSVGPATVRDIEVNIIQQESHQNTQGLLGMSFLKNFHYTLDLNKKIIRWN